MPQKPPTVLIILDGFGISSFKKNNAVSQSQTPNMDRWKLSHSYTILQASGKAVGLPSLYNGNSEVGHFTIGSGRIIPHVSTKLNESMQPHFLKTNFTLTTALKKFKPKKTIHLIGLVSDGNVHGNIKHLQALLATISTYSIPNISIHAFLDGRDTPPQSAQKYIQIIEDDLKKLKVGSIASVHGRYYAMDRNKNNERTEQSFDILTKQQKAFVGHNEYILNNYKKNITDEFIPPAACIENHTIKSGDGVIFFNFRSDRAQQIVEKLLTLDLDFFITPTLFRPDLKTQTLIDPIQATNTFLETLSQEKKTIFTIAETEKAAHITYFFNGLRHINIPTEKRVLIPSKTHKTFASDPTMQALTITEKIMHSLQNNPTDFYLINYANADMVGHSGDLAATIDAVECLDNQLGILYEEIVCKQKGIMYITADHGNAEVMFCDKSNQPCTSHTSNPVPFFMLSPDKKEDLALQGLSDIASFILHKMNIKIPQEMINDCSCTKQDPCIYHHNAQHL